MQSLQSMLSSKVASDWPTMFSTLQTIFLPLSSDDRPVSVRMLSVSKGSICRRQDDVCNSEQWEENHYWNSLQSAVWLSNFWIENEKLVGFHSRIVLQILNEKPDIFHTFSCFNILESSAGFTAEQFGFIVWRKVLPGTQKKNWKKKTDSYFYLLTF